jgi:hypothetical protein
LAYKLHWLSVPAVAGHRLGWRLTTLFGNTAGMPVTVRKKKGSLLPLLTVVFIISYGLMTMLIVEQGTTIQSQRGLIRALQSDSTQFWAMKIKTLGENRMAQLQAQRRDPSATQTPLTHGQALSAQTPSTQTPSTQAPSTQAPSVHTPSSQAIPQRQSPNRAGKLSKHNKVPQTQVPPMPASDLGDQRRELITL